MGKRGRGRQMKGGYRTGPLRQGGARKGGLPPQVREQVEAAVAKARAEDFAGAAEDFGALGSRAANKGLHLAAARFQLHAARNLVRAGDREAGVAAMKQSVAWGAEANDRHKAARIFFELVDDLKEGGHTEAAQGLQDEVVKAFGLTRFPDRPKAPTLNRAIKRRLPKRCGNCGAKVVAEEVQWSADGAGTPMCNYCNEALT